MTSIKKNFTYQVLYQILNTLMPLVLMPYVARTIGVKGVGVYAYIYSIVTYFMMVCVLGLANYGNREISQVREDRNERSKLFWEIYTMQFVISIVVLVVYIGFVAFVLDTEFRILGYISSLYVISSLLDINWFFFGMEQFKITVTRNSIIKILSTIAVFVFVKDEGDLPQYVFILAFSVFASQVALWPFLRRFIIYKKTKAIDVIKHIKPNLILFLPIFAISLYEVMDKIMLKMLCDVTQTGYYESANKIVRMPQTIFAALGTVMLPRISGMVKKESDRANAYVRDSLQFVVILASALMFGIALCSSRFIPFFYGDGYDACIDLLIMMTPIILFAPWKSVFRTQCLIPRKMDKSYIISVFLGAAVNLIVNMICIPHIQAKGAVIGTLVAEFVVCMYQTYAVSHILPIKTYLLDNWPFLACGFIMFIIVKMMDEYIPQGITGILAITLMGGGVYCFLSIGSYHFINKERYKHIKSLLLRKSM